MTHKLLKFDVYEVAKSLGGAYMPLPAWNMLYLSPRGIGLRNSEVALQQGCPNMSPKIITGVSCYYSLQTMQSVEKLQISTTNYVSTEINNRSNNSVDVINMQ